MQTEITTRHLTIPRQARYAVLGAEKSPSQVWFGLHGYGQLAHRFLRHLSTLDDGTRLLVAPEGLHRYYLDHDARMVGASWMTSEDRLTDIDDYVGWLDRLYGHVFRSVPRGDTLVVALGFSQGVHTLSRWLAFGEAEVDVAVLWGADVPPDLDLERHGEALRRPRLLLVAGEEDRHFDADAVREVRGRLRDHGISHDTLTFSGGHRLDASTLQRIASEAGSSPGAGLGSDS